MSAPISAIRTSAVLRFTARYALQELNLLGERGEVHPLYLGTQLTNGLIQVVDVGENPSDHEGMMGGESSLQCFPQSRYLRAQPPPSQLRQYLGIGGAVNQCIEHHPSGGTKHAGGHRRELDARILEHLLQALNLSCALLDLRLAVTGEVP